MQCVGTIVSLSEMNNNTKARVYAYHRALSKGNTEARINPPGHPHHRSRKHGKVGNCSKKFRTPQTIREAELAAAAQIVAINEAHRAAA